MKKKEAFFVQKGERKMKKKTEKPLKTLAAILKLGQKRSLYNQPTLIIVSESCGFWIFGKRSGIIQELTRLSQNVFNINSVMFLLGRVKTL